MCEENAFEHEQPDSEYLRYKTEMHKVFHEIGNLEQRMIDMQVCFEESNRANSLGLQNVYEEFKRLTDGSIIGNTKHKIEEMKNTLYDFKKELRHDVNFVKKCYKILPVLAKIKEFNDEDYERLIKILDLVR